MLLLLVSDSAAFDALWGNDEGLMAATKDTSKQHKRVQNQQIPKTGPMKPPGGHGPSRWGPRAPAL